MLLCIKTIYMVYIRVCTWTWQVDSWSCHMVVREYSAELFETGRDKESLGAACCKKWSHNAVYGPHPSVGRSGGSSIRPIKSETQHNKWKMSVMVQQHLHVHTSVHENTYFYVQIILPEYTFVVYSRLIKRTTHPFYTNNCTARRRVPMAHLVLCTFRHKCVVQLDVQCLYTTYMRLKAHKHQRCHSGHEIESPLQRD